jgi:hypothetical protein
MFGIVRNTVRRMPGKVELSCTIWFLNHLEFKLWPSSRQWFWRRLLTSARVQPLKGCILDCLQTQFLFSFFNTRVVHGFLWNKSWIVLRKKPWSTDILEVLLRSQRKTTTMLISVCAWAMWTLVIGKCGKTWCSMWSCLAHKCWYSLIVEAVTKGGVVMGGGVGEQDCCSSWHTGIYYCHCCLILFL